MFSALATVFAFSASLLAAAPAPQSGPLVLGVHLGEPVSALLVQRGDPQRIGGTADMPAYSYLYGSPIFEQVVTIAEGRVHGVELRPIPNMASIDMRTFGIAGVNIGDSLDSVKAKGGEDIAYQDDGSHDYLIIEQGYGLHVYVKDNRVIRLYAGFGHKEDLQWPAVHETVHVRSGTSWSDAIRVVTDNPRLGSASETYFVTGKACGNGGHWEPQRRTAQSSGAKHYATVTAKCSLTPASQTFYFDVTAFANAQDTQPQ